jgi:hypothetical protein
MRNVRRYDHAAPRAKGFDMCSDRHSEHAGDSDIRLLASVVMQDRRPAAVEIRERKGTGCADDRSDSYPRRKLDRGDAAHLPNGDAIGWRKKERVLRLDLRAHTDEPERSSQRPFHRVSAVLI